MSWTIFLEPNPNLNVLYIIPRYIQASKKQMAETTSWRLFCLACSRSQGWHVGAHGKHCVWFKNGLRTWPQNKSIKTKILFWEVLSQILGFHLIYLIPTAPDIVILLPITLWCCTETRFQKSKITNKFPFSNVWSILNYNINHSMKAINRSCIYAHKWFIFTLISSLSNTMKEWNDFFCCCILHTYPFTLQHPNKDTGLISSNHIF